MKHKHKNKDMDEQCQYWPFTDVNQTILELDGSAVNQTIEDFCSNNPDYEYEVCNLTTGSGNLFTTVHLSVKEIEYSSDGKRRGILIGGSRPPCNEELDTE